MAAPLHVRHPRHGGWYRVIPRTARKVRPCDVCPATIDKGTTYYFAGTFSSSRNNPMTWCAAHLDTPKGRA